MADIVIGEKSTLIARASCQLYLVTVYFLSRSRRSQVVPVFLAYVIVLDRRPALPAQILDRRIDNDL